MYKQPQIYNITAHNLRDAKYLNAINRDMQNNYYWSDDWSEEFYVELARAGFISTTYDTKEGLVLLPELQFEYAILDFKNLHISKKVQKLQKQKNYQFYIDTRFEEVLSSISSQHKHNWILGRYVEMLKLLYTQKSGNRYFELISVELVSDDGELIAGEVGYVIGDVYTSLSGFSKKDKKYNNYGTLQLVLLSQYLEKNGFAFWNLGHPHMEYKKRLGAKIYERDEFLKRWNEAIH